MQKKKEAQNHFLVPLEEHEQSISQTDIEIEDIRKKHAEKIDRLTRLAKYAHAQDQYNKAKTKELKEFLKSMKGKPYTYDFNGIPLVLKPKTVGDIQMPFTTYRVIGPDGVEDRANTEQEPEGKNPLKLARNRVNTESTRITIRKLDTKEASRANTGSYTDRNRRPNTTSKDKRSNKQDESPPPIKKIESPSHHAQYASDHMGSLYQQIMNDFNPATGVRLHLPNKKGEDNEVEGEDQPSEFELEDTKGDIVHQMSRDKFCKIAYAQRERLVAEAKERHYNKKPVDLLNPEKSRPLVTNLNEFLPPELKQSSPSVKRYRKGGSVGPSSEISIASIDKLDDKSSIVLRRGSLNESHVTQTTEGARSKRKEAKSMTKDLSRVLETGNFVDFSSKKKGEGKNSIVLNTEARLLFSMFDQKQSRNLMTTLRERATPYKERPVSPFTSYLTPAKDGDRDDDSPMRSTRNPEGVVEVDMDILRRKYTEMGIKMSKEMRAKTPSTQRPSTARMPSILNSHLKTSQGSFSLRGPETNWKKALQNGQCPPRIKKGKFFVTDV